MLSMIINNYILCNFMDLWLQFANVGVVYCCIVLLVFCICWVLQWHFLCYNESTLLARRWYRQYHRLDDTCPDHGWGASRPPPRVHSARVRIHPPRSPPCPQDIVHIATACCDWSHPDFWLYFNLLYNHIYFAYLIVQSLFNE